ncbi:Flavin carrier protein 1 [Madurella mycetomatis]|uniref:Flavin carrier protein 1 n=1 Tax=Madurella mycetomatis TaxID=100816 RepID=A0A175WFX5_9PEZI|nr:Flavin carrier protein 1 [Madurella mycetomatis]
MALSNWLRLFTPSSPFSLPALPELPSPTLRTGQFGDCLGGQSQFNITRFDAAYYHGANKTVAFHLEGTSNISNEFLMMHLSVDAYGKNRLEVIFDPCVQNISSLCPLNADVPATAWAALPVDELQNGGFPSFAFDMSDIEGSAKLRIFANSSRSEVGCFQAVLTNGNTLSHPEAIAPVLGTFAIIAILSSFSTAAYGISLPHMRMHYAHSISVLVVFETFQAIFFSCILSVDWPPLLVAWWTNFAWSAGLIFAPGMVRPINSFAGLNGSTTQANGATFTVVDTSSSLISRIFSRSVDFRDPQLPAYNASEVYGYTWSGSPAAPWKPLPDKLFGFPAVLSALDIPPADVFLVGLIWLLIAIALVGLAVVGFKISLEALVRTKRVKEDRMAYFRSHWTGYLGHAMLRTLISAFFMLMTLTMFQFTMRISVGTVAIATVVFIATLIGIIFLVAAGWRARTQGGRAHISSDRVVFYRTVISGAIIGILPAWDSTLKEHNLQVRQLFSIPLFRIRHVNNNPNRPTVHLDEPFVKKYGWMSARYRRTRWWYLAYYVVYLFVRAAFLGGGWNSPLAQVYGVLVLDILNFAITAILDPFEGSRNTAMAVWILNICKIVTTAMSIPFLPEYGFDRVSALALGIAIIVIQSLTVAALLVLIVLGAISSRMSLMRNREDFTPHSLERVRVGYYESMEEKAKDEPRVVREHKEPPPPPTPRFSVMSIQRAPKIEDEDEDAVNYVNQVDGGHADEGMAADNQEIIRGPSRISRASSARSSRYSTGSLPRAARPYRASWSSNQFGDPSLSRRSSVLTQRLSGSVHYAASHVSESDASSATIVRRQSSFWSLNTSPATPTTCVSSPGTPTPTPTPTPKILVTSPEPKRPPTALPEAPEPQE